MSNEREYIYPVLKSPTFIINKGEIKYYLLTRVESFDGDSFTKHLAIFEDKETADKAALINKRGDTYSEYKQFYDQRGYHIQPLNENVTVFYEYECAEKYNALVSYLMSKYPVLYGGPPQKYIEGDDKLDKLLDEYKSYGVYETVHMDASYPVIGVYLHQ